MRSVLAVLTVATVLVAAVAVFLVFMSGSSGEAEGIRLVGVPPDELAKAHLVLLTPRSTDVAKVTAAAAAEDLARRHPSARLREAVLVRIGEQYQWVAAGKLAWALNVDPETVYATPPMGPLGGEATPDVDFNPEFAIEFVDAETGEFLFWVEYGQKPATKPTPSLSEPTVAPTQVPVE